MPDSGARGYARAATGSTGMRRPSALNEYVESHPTKAAPVTAPVALGDRDAVEPHAGAVEPQRRRRLLERLAVRDAVVDRHARRSRPAARTRRSGGTRPTAGRTPGSRRSRTRGAGCRCRGARRGSARRSRRRRRRADSRARTGRRRGFRSRRAARGRRSPSRSCSRRRCARCRRPRVVSHARRSSPLNVAFDARTPNGPVITPSNSPRPPNATGPVGDPKSVMMPASS